MKRKRFYIDNIYLEKFNYDIINENFNFFIKTINERGDSINVYMPSGGATANKIINI